MYEDWFPDVEKALLGRRCETIEHSGSEWTLNLTGGGSIAFPIPWRLVADDRIVFADTDDGQWFGLAAPIDGEVKATGLVGSRTITEIRVDRQTLDLTMLFDGTVRLDAFSNSSGYEGWRIFLPPEHGHVSIIALGAGEVAIF